MTAIYNTLGKKVEHGSPGHENEETIARVVFLADRVEIEFESECFTQMTCDEFNHLLKYKELNYREMTHNGMSTIAFCD